MAYNVVVTAEAAADLERFILYLLIDKGNEQAAKNVMDDFDETIQTLKYVAGNLKLCENPKLRELGYRRMNFIRHRYFIMYRLEGNMAIVDNVFHELQDYENKMV